MLTISSSGLVQTMRISPVRSHVFSNLERSSNIAISDRRNRGGRTMDGLIYLIGLIVVIMAILSFFGLR